MHDIFGFAGQIESFRGPYVMHALSNVTKSREFQTFQVFTIFQIKYLQVSERFHESNGFFNASGRSVTNIGCYKIAKSSKHFSTVDVHEDFYRMTLF